MNIRKFLKLAPISAIVLGSLIAGATPAQAADYVMSNCTTGTACLWDTYNYAAFTGKPDAWFAQSIVLSTSNNTASSIANMGRYSVATFWDGVMGGGNINLNNPARGGQFRDPNLSNGTDLAPNENWNNRISSARFF